MSTVVRMSREQHDFLVDCASAGADGLSVRPSSEGVPAMPPSIVEWSYSRGQWRATATARGLRLVAALRAHDRRSA